MYQLPPWIISNRENMTHIEQAIRDAVEKGGYKWRWYLSDSSSYDYKDMEFRELEKHFLDPTFWQALGKARGWEGTYVTDAWPFEMGKKWEEERRHIPSWQYHWHRFIDHLASGKDAESFFASLATPTQGETK